VEKETHAWTHLGLKSATRWVAAKTKSFVVLRLVWSQHEWHSASSEHLPNRRPLGQLNPFPPYRPVGPSFCVVLQLCLGQPIYATKSNACMCIDR
jgi:hypothetical protein